jgi:O-acetyl-ADP-ribose deacetylase (regulator of RNase III)/RNA recognition motif-containing protein
LSVSVSSRGSDWRRPGPLGVSGSYPKMDYTYESDSDTQDSDYDVDSDAESVCSTASSSSLQVAPQQPSFKVFVSYPPSVKREELKEHLRLCGLSGNVKRLNMFCDKGKKSKGCGYIEFVPPNVGRGAINTLRSMLLLGEHKVDAKKYTGRVRKKSPQHKARRASKKSEACPPVEEDSSELIKVFVGAGVGCTLPDSITTAHLEEHLRRFKSAIQEVVIATDPRTKQSKGYGFVFFKSRRAAETATKKLNGSVLHGCRLSLELSKHKVGEIKDNPPPVESSGTKVFVGAQVDGKLPSTIQSVHLQAHFWEFEEVLQKVVIITNPTTNQSKGYGFAMFKTKGAAQAAIRKLGGTDLHGCKLKLEIAKTKEEYTTHGSISSQSSMATGYSSKEREEATSQQEGSGNRVHVRPQSGGRLPSSIQSIHLKTHFWKFEHTLEEAFIVTDPRTEQSKGFGFAVFKSKRAAEAAIREFNGSSLHGCTLKLEIAKQQKAEGDQSTASRSSSQTSVAGTHAAVSRQPRKAGFPKDPVPPKQSTQCKVFVGGLRHSVQDKHLQEQFSAFSSDIVNVYMYIPGGGDQPRKCGFVVFSSHEAAERAISALNGTKLHGGAIRVQHGKHASKPASHTPSVPSAVGTSAPVQPPPLSPCLPSVLNTGVPLQLIPNVPSTFDTRVPVQSAPPIPSVPSVIDVPRQSAPPTPNVPSISDTSVLVQPASIIDTSVPANPFPTISSVPSILDTSVPVHPAPLLPVAPQSSNTVLLSNINVEIDEDTIKALCKGIVTGVRFIPVDSASKQSVITFSCADDAKTTVSELNGKCFLGQKVTASFHLGNSPRVEVKVGNLISPLETPPSIEALIQLRSAEWNLLTSVNPAGSSLYQELTEPFKTNPNVKIDLLPSKVAIQLTGQKDAVESAHCHFKSQLQGHIPIEVNFVQTLMEVHPDFSKHMTERYGVCVTGIHDKSTLIKLDGSGGVVAKVREAIDALIAGFQHSVVQTQLPLTGHLLASAKKRLNDENVAVRLLFSPNSPQKVDVYSLSPNDYLKALKIVSSKPFIKHVPFQASPSLKQVPLQEVEAEFSVCVAMAEAEEKIYIMGFVKQDVTSAQEQVVYLVSKFSIQFSSFACGSEQMLYLKQKLKYQREVTQRFLESLPAEVLIEPNRPLHFKGSPKDIEISQKQLLEGPLLCGLQFQAFTFTAQDKFFLQLEKHVLKPMKREHPGFEYVRSGSEVEPNPRKGRRGSARSEESEFTVTVFSQEPEVFDKAVIAMEDITPCVRTLNVAHSNAIECVQQHIEAHEQQYRVRIVVPKDSNTRVLLFGLTEREAGQCLAQLRESIDTTVEAEKYVKVDHNQIKYFKQKKSEEWEELQGMCKSFRVYDKQKQEKGTALIRIEGTLRQVKTFCQRLDAMKALEYFSRMFSVSVERRYNNMWLKFWDAMIKEREESLDLIIVVDSPRRLASRSTSSAENKMEYEFSVCGGDENGTIQVEMEFSDPQIEQKAVTLSETAVSELEKGRKAKKLDVNQYFVDVCIDVKESKVILTAPSGCKDDLEAVEGEIERYVSNRTFGDREITVNDPVLALILGSKSKSSAHLAFANQLSKPHGVSVQCLRHPQCGLRLRGNKDSLDLVEPLIRQKVIQEIQSTIDEVKFPVIPSLIPFFETPEFVHFSAKIRDELCVLCHFPKAQGENQVFKTAFLKTASADIRIKLEICKGDITNEEVDAIVNAANEDLKHVGGLAKAIVQAGGDSIQMESDLYILQHGKLRAGGVVCLGAGNLACKKVLHAVGPQWVDGRSGEEQILYFTVLGCLRECQRKGLESVSFPAISTGIFSVPDHICIQASLKAVRDFCQVTTMSAITNVRFVLCHSHVAQRFAQALESDLMVDCIVRTSEVTSSPVAPESDTWEWMYDDGSFLPYQKDVNTLLNDRYGQDPKGEVSFSIGKHTYAVDFSTMLQTNLHTNCQRQIRQVPAAFTPPFPTSVQWKFMNDYQRRTPYSPSDSQAIETMFQSQIPGQHTIKGRTYTFDFTSMCQINIDTSYKRPIQRSVVNPALEGTVPDQPQERKEKKVTVTLRGPRANLTVAKGRLDEKLDGALANGDITFPSSLEGKILGIIQQQKLDFRMESAAADQKGKKKRVTFKGLSSSMTKATSAIQEEIINYHVAAAEQSAVELPPEWEPQTQNLQLCQVAQGSPEWSRVVGNFQRTLPSVRVIEVTRIQNKWLWERYVLHKQRLSFKNNGSVNERELFHGTRKNDPKHIYEGEDGFDMRFSSTGMWGLANYFAVNASYSDTYAYTRSDGTKEMFMVKVLTGDSYQSPSKQELRMPPEKPRAVGEKLQFSRVRYDTVTGTTRGSQVFMTYDNDKAYPAYLIQYY